MTLAEFLLARIAEDEDDASSIQKELDRWHRERAAGTVDGSQGSILVSLITPESAFHPARVLAECEAKRRIVEIHHPHDHHGEHGDYVFCDACQWDHGDDSPRIDMGIDEFGKPCRTLRALASVYSDHPDYDEAWRP